MARQETERKGSTPGLHHIPTPQPPSVPTTCQLDIWKPSSCPLFFPLNSTPHLHLFLSMPANYFSQILISCHPQHLLKNNPLLTAHWTHTKFLITIYKGLHHLHPYLPFQPRLQPLCTSLVFLFCFVFLKPDTKKKKKSSTSWNKFDFDFSCHESEIPGQKKN